MKIRILYLMLLVTSRQATTLAQTSKDYARIAQVENGLSTGVLFADSGELKLNIKERMRFYQVPSVSIALINNGKIEWAKSYGYADLKEKRQADTNTIYQVASISKSINALCILKLYQDGRLAIEQDIRPYLKTWKLNENEYSTNRTITIRELLSHTAGF